MYIQALILSIYVARRKILVHTSMALCTTISLLLIPTTLVASGHHTFSGFDDIE